MIGAHSDMPGVPRRLSMQPNGNGSNPGSRHASRPGSLEMSLEEDSDEDDKVFKEQEAHA